MILPLFQLLAVHTMMASGGRQGYIPRTRVRIRDRGKVDTGYRRTLRAYLQPIKVYFRLCFVQKPVTICYSVYQ